MSGAENAVLATDRATTQKRTLLATSLVLMLSLAACGKTPFVNAPASNPSGNSAGIIGGSDVTDKDDFSKSVVALYNVTVGSLCTASIVSDQILVTAAHCVDGPASSLRVVFGKNLENETDRVIEAVISYETSPLWPTRSSEDFNAGDIAVVRFEGGLPAGYHAAKLLTDDTVLTTGANVLLAGYGISNGVTQEGAGTLRSVVTTIKNGAYSESEILIDQTTGKGACHGDSGGPAYVQVNGQWALWGVTNRGVNDPNNDCSVSAAYAKIPFYQSWIATTTKKLLAAKSSATFKLVGSR
jgi:secreted trypsin-like serine protease